jgi:transcriptional regulator with XRE-family HTH domain
VRHDVKDMGRARPSDLVRRNARQQLGPALRSLRRSRKLTLRELSERTGLASSTLSKIENNLISPTYDSLLSIAEGLRIDMAQLFDAGSTNMTVGRWSVTLKSGGVTYNTPSYDYEMLCTNLSGKRFFPIFARIKSHDIRDFPTLPRHAGEEFIYVLSGRIEVHTEHYEPISLGLGDSVYFDSSMGHACISVGAADAQILWVTSDSGVDLSGTETKEAEA